jgi:hypothetical protein
MFKEILETKLVPVVVFKDLSEVEPTLSGLRSGGVNIAEICFRTEVTAKCLEKAIKLYIDISLLVKKVDFYADTLVDFPQHEMIILSQLFGHLLQIIEVISFDSFDEENFDSFCMSLEGMEWNFEEIKPCILASLKREEVKKFRIVNSDYKKSNKQDQIS